MTADFRVCVMLVSSLAIMLLVTSLDNVNGEEETQETHNIDIENITVMSLRRVLPEPCNCTYLVPQSIIAVGRCGDCARCAWNLHTYAYTFKDKEPHFNNDIFLRTLQGIFEHCVEDIPYPPTFYDNVECVEHLQECKIMTEKMFKFQCKNILPDLPPPPEIVHGRSAFERELDLNKPSNKGLKQKHAFNGPLHMYKMTCPVYYRRDAFTYAILYEQGFKHYGIPKTKENEWTEATTVIQIAQQLRPQVIKDADENIEEAYGKFHIPFTRQKFCGYDDVFTCVHYVPPT